MSIAEGKMMGQNPEPTMEEKFRYNGELVIKVMLDNEGVNLAYDEPSVAWIDDYIERKRDQLSQDTIQGLISVLGSYLGECIRYQFGGEWKEQNGQWAIEFDEHNAVFPINKVSKQFKNGRKNGDSIHSLFTMIPVVFKLNKP